MAEQRNYVDYVDPSFGDTGEDVTDAIQPISDGEGASQSVFRRPSENLRHRTEVIRDLARELSYYRDFNSLAIEGSGGTITWGGTVANGGTGIITQSGSIVLRPFLTPSSSKKGTLKIGTSGTNAIDYNIQSSAYHSEGVDRIYVEHRDGGASTSLSVSITEGPVKRIVVLFDSSNTGHDSPTVVTAVNNAISADSFLNGKLLAVDDGAAATAIATASETRIEGTADQEAHTIPSGRLDTVTGSNPLAEGDTLAIWYRYLVEPASGFASDPKGGVAGGRWESNPDRSTDDIPTGSFFVTSDDPDKIPGAVPICKVLNDELVFIDGSRFAKDLAAPVGSVTSVSVDDSNFSGTTTNIVNGGISNPLSPTTVQQALEDVDNRLAELRAFTYVCTDGTNSTGGDFNSTSAVVDAVNALSNSGGTIFIRRGVYDLGGNFTVPSRVVLKGEHGTATELQLTSGGGTLELKARSWVSHLRLTSTAGTDTLDLGGAYATLEEVTLDSFPSVTQSEKSAFFKGVNFDLADVTLGQGAQVDRAQNMGTVTLGSALNTISNSAMEKLVTAGTQAMFDFSRVETCQIAGSNDDVVVDLADYNRVSFIDCLIGTSHTTTANPVVRSISTNTTSQFINCFFVSESNANTMIDIADVSDEGMLFSKCNIGSSTAPTLVSLSNSRGAVKFDSCWFSDEGNGSIEHLNDSSGSVGLLVDNCRFDISTDDVSTLPVNFGLATVRSCYFNIDPAKGTFAGEETGRTTPMINLKGNLIACTLDLNDREMELSTQTSSPLWTPNNGDVPLALQAIGSSTLSEALVYDVRLVNVNRSFDFLDQAFVGGKRCVFRGGFSVEFTATAPAAGADINHVLSARVGCTVEGIAFKENISGTIIDGFVQLKGKTVIDNCSFEGTPHGFALNSGGDIEARVSNCTLNIDDNIDLSTGVLSFSMLGCQVTGVNNGTESNTMLLSGVATEYTIVGNTLKMAGLGTLGYAFKFGSTPGGEQYLTISGNTFTSDGADGTAEITNVEPENYVVVGNTFIAEGDTAASWANNTLPGTATYQAVTGNAIR